MARKVVQTPYIRVIAKLHDTDSLELHWLKGSWLKEWKEWNLGLGKNTRPYTDTIPMNSVILWCFMLSIKGVSQ